MLPLEQHATPWAFFLATNRKEVRWILLNIACYSLGTVVTLGIAYFLSRIIDALTAGESIGPLVVLFIAALVGHEIFYRLGHIVEVRVNARIRRTTKRALFAYSTGLSFGYFADRFAGQIAHQISTAADSFELMKNTITNDFIDNSWMLIMSTIMLAFVYPLLGLAVGVWAVFFILGLRPFTKKITIYAEQFAQHSSNTTGALVDMYSNIGAVKVYGKSSDQGRINGKIENEYASQLSVGKWDVLSYAYQGISGVILGCALTAITAHAYVNGLISVGEIVLIAGLGMKILDEVYHIGHTISSFIRTRGECSQALKDILVAPAISDGSKRIGSWKSVEVVYDNVSFSYGQNKKILKNFNLKIAAGQKVGLVGLSGAGKTTMVNLLLRFIDPQSGRVNINDMDLTAISQESLRSYISYISQDASLFHMSIADNIRYGSPKVSRKEVEEAARKAYAHEFISLLPEGYDTIVGERGVKLSGGQRQRIAIARAMLKNAPLFLLDEATSALDSDSEAKVQRALKLLMKGKTVIAVAHRLSTLQFLDRIIFIENGKVLEDGTHAQLIALNGKYAKLWNMQSGGFLPAEV